MAVSLQSDEEILTFWESHGKEAGNVILLDDILSLVKPDECANTLKSELASVSARIMSDGEDEIIIDPSKYPYNSV